MQRKSVSHKILNFLKDYILVNLYLILTFIFIRVLECIYIVNVLNENIPLSLFWSRCVNYDTIFLLIFNALLLIPLVLISLIHFKSAKFLTRLIALFVILFNLALTQYFLTNFSLLTQVLFEFSVEELTMIVSNEFTSERAVFWVSVIGVMTFSIYILYFKIKYINPKRNVSFGLIVGYSILMIIGLLSWKHTYKAAMHFEKNYHYLLANSKITFFARSYFNKISKQDIEVRDLLENCATFQKAFDDFEFCDIDLPLVHNELYLNPLGPFFKSKDTFPNIVIIISESLSSSYSGDQNDIGGSITPFVDSLARSGLYWSHFFSKR